MDGWDDSAANDDGVGDDVDDDDDNHHHQLHCHILLCTAFFPFFSLCTQENILTSWLTFLHRVLLKWISFFWFQQKW